MPLLIFSAIGGVQAGGLAGLESFKRMAGCNAIIGVFRLPCLAMGVWLWGLKGAILGLVISQAASCVIYGICLRDDCHKRGIRISYHGFRTEKHTLLRFSIPTLMAGLIIGPVDWLCNVLLVRQPGGYAQMGIYNATVQWQSAIKFVPLKILDVTLPVLSNLYSSGEARKYYRVLKSSLFVTALSGLFVGLPIVILSRYIMAGYGKGFEEGYPVLIIMTSAAVMYMVARVLSQVALSRGKAIWDFIFCSIYSVALITSWLMLLKRGATGLAWAVLAGYIVMTCALAIYVLREATKDLGKISKRS